MHLPVRPPVRPSATPFFHYVPIQNSNNFIVSQHTRYIIHKAPKVYINIHICNSMNISNVKRAKGVDLWAPCLIHLNITNRNRGARVPGCNSDSTAGQ